MPHQCTNCDLAFEDGSKEMLGGCPECGGNKFQFLPKGHAGGTDSDCNGRAESSTSSTHPSSSSPGSSPRSSTSLSSSSSPSSPPSSSPRASTTAPLESTVADGLSVESSGPDDDIIEAPAEPVEPVPDGEDRAQASARRDVVSEDELPPAEAADGPHGDDDPASGDERPDLTQLRQELNDQFESIKILRPGEYELNLMELYDRQEYIIALEEDGRYVIDVPDTWRDDD